MSGKLLDRMQWQTEAGQIMDADRRYVMLRADVLMGVFRRLGAKAGQEALSAFAESVRESGGKSAKAYFEQLGGDTEKLLGTMCSYSAELGWGSWQFTRDEKGLRLQVHNSPFAAGFGPSETPVCHAIAGMLGTVGELVLQGGVTVEETQCAAQHACAHCSFRILPGPQP